MTELADDAANEIAVRPDGAALVVSAEGNLGEFRSLRSDVWRQFRRHKGALTGMVLLVLIVIGCFMDIGPAILIFTPILLPIAQKIGVDPVHFGVILVLNLMIGLLTPPVGMVLYVLARVSKLPFETCMAATMPTRSRSAAAAAPAAPRSSAMPVPTPCVSPAPGFR